MLVAKVDNAVCDSSRPARKVSQARKKNKWKREASGEAKVTKVTKVTSVRLQVGELPF